MEKLFEGKNKLEKMSQCAYNLVSKKVNRVGKMNLFFLATSAYIVNESVTQNIKYAGDKQRVFYRKPTRSVYQDDDGPLIRYFKSRE